MVPGCLAALVAATTVLARTPAGFTPSSETDLIVEYNGFAPLNGMVISRSGKSPNLSPTQGTTQISQRPPLGFPRPQ